MFDTLRRTGNVVPSFSMVNPSIIPVFNIISGCNLPLGAIATAKGLSTVLLFIVNCIVATRVNDPMFIVELSRTVMAISDYAKPDIISGAITFDWIHTLPNSYQRLVSCLLSIMADFSAGFPEIGPVVEYVIAGPLSASDFTVNTFLPRFFDMDPSTVITFVGNVSFMPTNLTVGDMLINAGIYRENYSSFTSPEIRALLIEYQYGATSLLSSLDVSTMVDGNVDNSGLFGNTLSVSTIKNVLCSPATYAIGLCFLLVRHGAPIIASAVLVLYTIIIQF